MAACYVNLTAWASSWKSARAWEATSPQLEDLDVAVHGVPEWPRRKGC